MQHKQRATDFYYFTAVNFGVSHPLFGQLHVECNSKLH